MELDHVFVMVTPGAPERTRLEKAGLVPTYERAHAGQGTANVWYVLDNAFLELLWVADTEEALSSSARRLAFVERADWKLTGASPFGIAWRGEASSKPRFDVWAYTPPYLPAGSSIDVAVDGDGPRHPVVFRSPGAVRPGRWTGWENKLQRLRGFSAIESLTLHCPAEIADSTSLSVLAEAGVLSLIPSQTEHGIVLSLSGLDGSSKSLRLPELAWC